jgi:DNA (cytosine-5)-methyltransferase 1
MKHLGDITKIHGDKIEPVDCITFGSPCQGLSMAGKRLGFDDNRSVLFLDAARIIKEMRTATNGMYPTFAVWENVPGAFSSNGGEDFRAVLEELARVEQPDTSIPKPPKGGRWSKAGAIAGNGWSLAWRQLDAQYWGVPQRRKRIALVADFGGQRAAEILFERTSLSGNPDESVPTWKEIARLAANCPAGNDSVVGGAIPINTQIATRYISMGERTGIGIGEDGDPAYTLQANHEHGVCYCIAGNIIDRSETAGANGSGVKENQSYTLNTVDRPAVAYKVFDARGNGDGRTCPTITGDHENRITDYTAIAVERKTFNEQSFSHYKESDKSSILKAKAGNIGNGSECLIAEKAIRWIVRRLTPVECERLQGFPDNYTNIGDWTDSKGKKHKYADSPRYKALGNSIALPQWFWIAQKMKPYLSTSATLGSLFDGIGGFPLVWQKTYGNGTARWASEIEDFPIAVTKRRFGEE